MKLKCLLFLFILQPICIFAQQKFTISGYITEAKSGEKLNGVSVYISDLNVGTQSNNFGFYSITVAEGNYELIIKHAGYKSEIEQVNLQQDVNLNFALQNQKGKLQEFKVKTKKNAPIQQTTQTSMNSLPIAQIKALPAIMGEVDVLKSLQLLPGVQGGTEGSAGIYVRGGSPDQNLFLLDGVPVYNVNHLGGFFSTFNADAISNVDLYKGGFPARFGGRLSSVIDIKMKEGNNKSYHGEASIGIISSKILLEGPIKQNKGSFMISGRRTYIDVFLRPLIRSQSKGQADAGYFFYDLNAKLNYEFTPKDHLYLSGYFGRDKFDLLGKETTSSVGFNLNWGNITGVMRWNHLFNKKLFGNLIGSYSSYDNNIGINMKETTNNIAVNTNINFNSGIQDHALKYDFDYMPTPNHTIKFGASSTFHTYTPSVNKFSVKNGNTKFDTVLVNNTIKATEIDAYVEDDWKISNRLKGNFGVHFGGFKVQNNFYKSIQPRASLRYLLNNDVSIKASYANMNQFVNLLAFDGIGLPTDLWVPVTDKIKPQNSNQYALGFAGTLNNAYELTGETYYKDMQNIIDYKDASSYLSNTGSYENIVEMGRGVCYGGELMLQKKEGKLQGLVSYGLAWAKRKYNEINNGEWFYFKYDRRHDFKIAAMYKLNDRVEFSGDWIWNSGSWTTLPILMMSTNVPPNFFEPTPKYYYPNRNNYNMMNTHRMDLGVRFTKQRKAYERTWSLGCYNVYGRKNPFFIYTATDNTTNQKVYKQTSIFGFPLPYVTYGIKF